MTTPMADIDDQIDALYQGPLDAFTEARNALAKVAKRADLKTLTKPSLPAWVVNQLFWHRRPLVDRLVAAAEAVRAAHLAALAGKSADLRSAEGAHRELVREALAEARTVLAEAGHPATPATIDAVRDTLQALPSEEAEGRLTKPLAPRGFEALAGLSVAPRPTLRIVEKRPAAAKSTAPHPPAADGDPAADREAARARARAEAEREKQEREKRLRAAQQALEAARDALDRADEALAEAEKEVLTRRAERAAALEALARATKAVRE
jgi:hypothetical protein